MLTIVYVYLAMIVPMMALDEVMRRATNRRIAKVNATGVPKIFTGKDIPFERFTPVKASLDAFIWPVWVAWGVLTFLAVLAASVVAWIDGGNDV